MEREGGEEKKNPEMKSIKCIGTSHGEEKKKERKRKKRGNIN
jgi:hypothetical protein